MEESEDQRGQVIYPVLHSWQVAEPKLKLGCAAVRNLKGQGHVRADPEPQPLELRILVISEVSLFPGT